MAGPADEQPPPLPSAGPDCWLLVMADMEERRRVGVGRYGTPLRPHNGRDALIDAYQEALDLCVYLRQAIEERDAASEAARLRLALAALADTAHEMIGNCLSDEECLPPHEEYRVPGRYVRGLLLAAGEAEAALAVPRLPPPPA